ncbi:MAG: hypothetical protein ACE5F1_09295, partial [Planctomycetota bacterium]
MLPRLSIPFFALALSSICLSASFFQVDEKQKAFLHQADGSLDESLGTIAALAPVIFEHDQNDPKKEIRFADFQVATEQVGLFKVLLNGAKLVGMDEIKAAFGKKGPTGFDTPAMILLPVKLLAGQNRLQVELKGKEDACVELSVLAPDSVSLSQVLSPQELLHDQNDPKKELRFLPFDVAADRIGILKVECCTAHKFKISHGRLTLNGIPIVEKRHFDAVFPKPAKLHAEIMMPIRIPAGSNLIGVELKGLKDASVKISVLVPQTTPLIDPTVGNTSDTQLLVAGTALKPGSRILVRGGAATAEALSNSERAFSLLVQLKLNKLNKLFVSEVIGPGQETPPLGLEVVQDQTPPEVFIDFPPADSELTNASITVAGRVSDLLSGFMGLQVKVNGIAATVNEGIGTNGTFEALNVPLVLNQANEIVAVAKDELGNTSTAKITVTRVPLTGAQMSVLSGNNQKAKVNTLLPAPIAVKVRRSNGTPFANKIVTFTVIRSNGRLSPNENQEGSLSLQVATDSAGIARSCWRLGSDAGCGNNRVEVTSTSINGSTFFCASADPEAPKQINIGSGNNQRVEAGKVAPERLRVWVSDACNGIRNVPVEFTVTEGTATLGLPGADAPPETALTVLTGLTGHAEVAVVPGPGNNRVQANFPTNPSNRAEFVVFGVARSSDTPTSFRALVLDNAQQPIQGATATLVVAGVVQPVKATGLDGQVHFTDLTRSGRAELFIDGLTATHVGGADGKNIPKGSFPALHFESELVPNAENALPTPVLLPPLDPKNAKVYDGTKDVELTVAGVEGLRMIIEAGSMRRADNTVPSPSDPAIMSLNQVHFDEIPMPMPDGAAPPFSWTLQPAGATFDPPVRVVYPNMSGLPPGSVSYFLSFNHDTGQFEIVATGAVDADGLTISSDPGDGISVSGWGCNCPPYAVTGDCEGCTDGPEIKLPPISKAFKFGPWTTFGIEQALEGNIGVRLATQSRCCSPATNVKKSFVRASSEVNVILSGPFE